MSESNGRARLTIFDELYPEIELDGEDLGLDIEQELDELPVPESRIGELSIEIEADLVELDRRFRSFSIAVEEAVDALGSAVGFLSAVSQEAVDAAVEQAAELARSITGPIDWDQWYVGIARASGDTRESIEILREMKLEERNARRAIDRSIRNQERRRVPRRAALGRRGGYKYVSR